MNLHVTSDLMTLSSSILSSPLLFSSLLSFNFLFACQGELILLHLILVLMCVAIRVGVSADRGISV